MVFGPCKFRYPNYDADEEKAEFDEDREVNKWNEVKDFKWIKAEQSPHWSAMSEEEIANLPVVYMPEDQ